ncbi:hypothetical protein HMI54_009918 [Coelomomyces lativittatus]|nr:hypothetical protein HMI54_009918 [Coelomomyces lativittatus]KAJ1516568.1 hypothetical protein HMI55_001943 [Coelomomyces lativittatus]
MPPKRKLNDEPTENISKTLKFDKSKREEQDEVDLEELDELLETLSDEEEDEIHRKTTQNTIQFVNERIGTSSIKKSNTDVLTTTLGTTTDSTGMVDYSQTLVLKKDHSARPLWINPDTGYIILEAFSPIAEQAQDFLVAIAEPVSRPTHIHEYRLTAYSLYAAVSVGLEVDNILSVLNRLSKTDVPHAIIQFIKNFTVSYGKIKLVLKHNRYYIESEEPDILQTLLKDPILQAARILPTVTPLSPTQDLSLVKKPTSPTTTSTPSTQALLKEKAPILDYSLPGVTHATPSNPHYLEQMLANEDVLDLQDTTVHAFEIEGSQVETVKKHCNALNFPMLEEYDFRNDTTTHDLLMDLKPTTQIRPYQEKALSKMFGNGRARSGIIVLPCGAGKTLVGITAACTIRKSTLVLCTSAVSVAQWKQQFLTWSNLSEKKIAAFTSETKHWVRSNK